MMRRDSERSGTRKLRMIPLRLTSAIDDLSQTTRLNNRINLAAPDRTISSMLWPLILPFQITCVVLTTIVIALTVIAPWLKWRRAKTFLNSTIVALLLFVPSCTALQVVVDRIRFGHFEYASFADVQDFRAKRYLPPSATEIKMYKTSNGYFAWYHVSKAELHSFLDNLWNEHGTVSIAKRSELDGEGLTVPQRELPAEFSTFGWTPLAKGAKFHSPVEPDGGGAVYYFDEQAGIVQQRTGYW